MGISKANRDVASPLQLPEAEEGEVLPKDSIEAPSMEKNNKSPASTTSTQGPELKSTGSEQTASEESACATEFCDRSDGQEEESKKKKEGTPNTSQAIKVDSKPDQKSPAQAKDKNRSNQDQEKLEKAATEKKKQEEKEKGGGGEEEENKVVVPKTCKPARRPRRACTAVVNYNISSDSDIGGENESYEDEVADGDGDYDDNASEEDDDEDDMSHLIDEDGSDLEENSDMEDASDNERKPKPQKASAQKKVTEKGSDDEEVKEEEETEGKASHSSTSKKRKKAPAKPIKQEGEPSKKKSKGPRVSEAIIKEVAGKMLAVLIEKYTDGVKEIPMDELAGSITKKDGKPYTNHRSDAIMEGIKRLKTQNQAEKIKYQRIGAAKLTEAEINKIPKEKISSDPQKVLKQRCQQFLEKLSRHKKGGKGEKIVAAANAVWDKLLDGDAYSSKQLVAVTGYSATNSSGFEAIMVTLKSSGMVANKGKGKYAFTEKVFPHGRP